jgi:PAP2 superfamily
MNSILDVFVAFSLAAVLIVGGYQIYFLPQKHPFRASRSLLISLDNRIPFRPGWVWIYSLLYYPFIVSTILTIHDFRQFAYTSANFLTLLVVQVTIAFLFPIKAPDHWRGYDSHNSISERFLGFIHSFDKGGNCFPSMHIAVAMLASLHIVHNLLGEVGIEAYGIFAFPLIIMMSCLFTKQHYLLDLPAGCALAVAVFSLYPIIYS